MIWPYMRLGLCLILKQIYLNNDTSSTVFQ